MEHARFIDRESELAHLEQLFASNRAELFILYGRRRVGKTELLRAFCEGKPHAFFVATLSSDADQLAAFSQVVWAFTHDESPYSWTCGEGRKSWPRPAPGRRSTPSSCRKQVSPRISRS